MSVLRLLNKQAQSLKKRIRKSPCARLSCGRGQNAPNAVYSVFLRITALSAKLMYKCKNPLSQSIQLFGIYRKHCENQSAKIRAALSAISYAHSRVMRSSPAPPRAFRKRSSRLCTLSRLWQIRPPPAQPHASFPFSPPQQFSAPYEIRGAALP